MIESRRAEPKDSTQSAGQSLVGSRLSKGSAALDSKDEPKHRTIIVRNSTPVCGSNGSNGSHIKIDDQCLSSAQSPPFVPPVPSLADSSAPTLSVIDSKVSPQTEHTSQTGLNSTPVVSSNVLQHKSNSNQMSPSPVRVVSGSPSTTTSSNRIARNGDRNGSSKSRPVSAPEASIQDFIVDQLTDDEKAILQRSSRKSTKDDHQIESAMKANGKSGVNGSATDHSLSHNGNANKPKPANDKPKPRIITLAKPLPKPEPKPAEPKYVNGKLVFGQIPVKPFLAKGSVAERVLLFEKCPEKTSVTKVKKNEKREKVTYNKVGQWMRLDNSTANTTNNNKNITNNSKNNAKNNKVRPFIKKLPL